MTQTYDDLDLEGVRRVAGECAAIVTRELEARLSGGREPGGMILLKGAMGAGKTQFTRFFIEALGPPPEGERLEIASPSFALHHRHPTARARVDHFDLYRLESADELESIAFWDFFRREKPPRVRVALIEWAERLTELGVASSLPKSWGKWELEIKESASNKRTIIITS